MEKEPLLPPYTAAATSRKKSPLSSLPEDDAISIPIPQTPAGQLKDRLVFGPSPSPDETSQFLDSINTTSASGSPSAAFSSALDPFSDRLLPRPSTPRWPGRPIIHRSKTAPAISVINDLGLSGRIPKPQSASQSIVRHAVIFLVGYLSLGVAIYCFQRRNFTATETHPIVDAFYFCIVTMCTIGYGDITPNSPATKLFSIMFVLVGFGFIDILLSGMFSHVLDLQENYLLRSAVKHKEDQDVASAQNRSAGGARAYFIDVKKGRMRIRMKVGLALGVVVLCISVGTLFMHFSEGLGWLDSLYLSVMSVTTVGYGDRAFSSLSGRIFASIWLLVSTLTVARAFLFLAEARVDKRQRTMAKWVLGHDMTVSEFLAADIDNDGSVSKAEYVIYKLKEMGKVSEKDVLQVSKTFDRLDSGNCGKISLSDLMEKRL